MLLSMNIDSFIAHLDEHGYAVMPGFLDLKTTAAVRAHMNSLMPAIEAPELPDRPRIHTLRHPIPGEIMATLVKTPGLIELTKAMLKTTNTADLRMLEQVLIRTDPSRSGKGANGWHVDMAFLPEHYNSSPRGTYYHMVHCLNTVKPGGGAFTIIPGSHKKNYAATAKVKTPADLMTFKANPAEDAGVDLSAFKEVCANEGDLLVFNPMCLHSGSYNSTNEPRYVYFISFMDKSAKFLHEELTKTNYYKPVPEELSRNLPRELAAMFDYGR
jgi:ectoine hydroxylase-related dioxygenase (phytanoyl-CoA dioxygenase family)